MKRLRWWLFNLAVAVSLVLCIAVAAGWIESYLALDSLDLGYRAGTQWKIHSSEGRIGVHRTVYAYPTDRSPAIQWEHLPNSTDLESSARGWGGFDIQVSSQRLLKGGMLPVSTTTSVRVPYWVLVFGALILPSFRAVILLRDRRRLRMAGNICPTCGYDLRATPDRCPECGLIPMKAHP